MNKTCPLCLHKLEELSYTANESNRKLDRINYYCTYCYDPINVTNFHISYYTGGDIVYFTIYVDGYCIESNYLTNKTVVSKNGNPSISYADRMDLHLPLVHFEVDSLEKIREKLKLILIMM